MPAKILSLINKSDNAELVRDTIAGILVLESEAQQALALAEAPPLSPDPWKLRVFLERSNPWEEFLDLPEDTTFAVPIVSVSLDSLNYDPSKSDIVHRQHATGTFHIDCYGYGATALAGDGHVPGDLKAALEAQRAAKLVRNILMSAHYVTLGMTGGKVWNRWLQSVQFIQPLVDRQAVQNVLAARMTFQVSFNEFSPQYDATTLLEELFVSITRAETGEVSLTFQVGESPSP